MKVIYYDGSVLECNTLWFADGYVIADDIYNIPLIEILRIESL